MEPKDVEHVKIIIRDELGPALEAKAREIEQRMIATTTAFHADIRKEVRKDHAENRTRMQLIDDKAGEAVQQSTEAAQQATQAATSAAKAVAGNDYIVGRLDRQDVRGEKTQSVVMDLLGEVRSWSGRSEGLAVADAAYDKKRDKYVSVLKWAGGTLLTGEGYHWIARYLHWWGGGN